jgi:hypothetical protein
MAHPVVHGAQDNPSIGQEYVVVKLIAARLTSKRTCHLPPGKLGKHKVTGPVVKPSIHILDRDRLRYFISNPAMGMKEGLIDKAGQPFYVSTIAIPGRVPFHIRDVNR